MSVQQYLPALQTLLKDIQNMTPAESSTSTQQSQALATIANTGVSENQDFLNLISSSANQRVSKYIDMSHRLVDYNEIYNTNKYVEGELQDESERIGGLKNNIKNKIFISKQRSLAYLYEKNKTLFLQKLFLFSCFVLIIMIMLTSAYMSNSLPFLTYYVLLAIITFVYIVTVLIYVSSNAYRTHSDWEKYHFASMNRDKNSKSCN